MKKILNVYELYEIKHKGFIITGINEAFDSLSIKEIKNIIGNKIVLRDEDNKSINLDVIDVYFSNSLINKKNIFINVKHIKQLYEYISKNKLEIYSDI